MSETPYMTSVHVDAEPAVVFPYLTDPTLIVRWMGDWADLDPTVDGRFVVDINGVPIRGRYLEVEPPHRLVVTWGAAGSAVLPPGSTIVEITLRAEGRGTLLELVHRNLPPEERSQHDVGWGHFLARLAIAAAGGDPGPDPWADASEVAADGV